MKLAHGITLLALGVLAALPYTGVAGGFQINEQGARAMAQASAFAARANDPSALYFNPAGIAQLRGTKLMLGTTIISPRYSYYGPYNLNSNQEWEMNSNTFFPSTAYLTHSVVDGALNGFAAGIGVMTPYGLGTSWDENWTGKAITRDVTLTTFYITPTLAYRFSDLVSIGVGANIAYGNVSMSRAVTNFDPEMDLELDGDGIGVSWNVGVIVKPVEDFTFGFSYRASTEIEYSGTADFHPIASLSSQFPGGDVSTTITNPSTWFAGVAWQATDDLVVELDVQGIGWSSYDQLEIDFVTDNNNTSGVLQQDNTQIKNYEDTFILRLGAEYELGVAGIKLRAGYLYDSNPVPDEYLEPILPDADRHGLSVGFGLDVLPSMTLDVAYTHLFFNDRETTMTSQKDGLYFDGMYRGSAEMVGINLTYRWD